MGRGLENVLVALEEVDEGEPGEEGAEDAEDDPASHTRLHVRELGRVADEARASHDGGGDHWQENGLDCGGELMQAGRVVAEGGLLNSAGLPN